jgi:hypothetical protein
MNKEDRRSVSSAIHMIGGTIVNWIWKTQELVMMSSTEAEYVSMVSGACEVRFLQQFLLHGITFCTMPGIYWKITWELFIWLGTNKWVSIQNTLTCAGTSFVNCTREKNSHFWAD